MHIKQIIIQGFKSYKDQTVIEPFSSKHNVIVGRNGSGKSNFFAAIRFVLSDAYTQMGREERQALLHEGSGSAVMSAYVEIIFDNTDERFPTGKDELILRRTIGLKKDEYSLDRKNATKSDVMNLLESAGFSRSNPYYIVPQGRVTTLTNMKDPERLTLLKEVAGTQVYEARRAESLKIMGDTDAKRAKIDELLVTINERLNELEEEKEELRIYQEKDKDKRCLEYTIYNREKEASTKALEALEEQKNRGAEDSDQLRESFMDGERELSAIDQEIKDLKQQMELLKVDKQQYDNERTTIAKERAQVELEVSSIVDGQSSAEKARARHKRELQEVQNSIRDREKQLSSILPQYEKAHKSEGILKSQLDDAESQRQRLYAKQGRSAKFKSKKERDDWLKKEIDDVNIALAQRKAVTMQTTEDIADLQKDVKTLNAEINHMRDKLDNRGDNMESLSAEVQKAKDVRDRLQDQRKELWREEAKLDSVMKNSQDELNRAERFLSNMMDQNTSRGIASVRRIKAQHGLEGVYGTLAELFTVKDMYKTAAEVTAGNSLFHYVVDNEETATKVLEILQKEKAGRVTFMPLNRLKPSVPKLPDANDARPLIQKLNFDPKYTKAFQQVFGKTVVCPRLEIASQYARSHNVTGITQDGDRSDKKGALTGGFHDPRQSRLDAVKAVAKWRDEVDGHLKRSTEIKRELEQKDQEVTRALGDLQKIEQQRRQGENSYGPLQQELRGKMSDLQSKQDALESKQRSKTNVDSALRELSDQQTSYETELASEFKKALSQDEEQQLDNIANTIPNLKKNYLELSNSRSELEAQKSTIEVELKENLRPRLDQLKTQEHENGSEMANSKLTERQKELKRLTKGLESIVKNLQEAETAIDDGGNKLAKHESRRAAKQQEQEEIAKEIENYQRKMERGMSKRARLVENAAEASKNIRDLGVLPQEAFTKFARLDSNQAIKRLHTVNEELMKYGHVNKKAYQQYVNFTKQREDLEKRRSELDSSQESIRELIDVLDQRKDEAIERTFKQVSKNFATVFEQLVPAGKGRLIIQRRSDKAVRAEEGDSDEDEARDSVENYTGVGIAVSFNSKHDEQQRIQQLSGGQKSLCALALVFAIQKCDPAPFYLFDEIDANLDAQYRTAVAALLHEISEDEESGGAQFICTTFRPEMVQVAAKCYGVSYSNKTSSIDAVDKETALNFVEGRI